MRRRCKPVRRDEVLLAGRHPKTMPLGTYSVEHYATERFVGKRAAVPYTLTKYVGVPALWQPLIDELAAEAATEEEATALTHARLMNGTPEERRLAASLARREPLDMPVVPEFTTTWRDGVGEYDCDHCGIRFLGGHWWRNQKRVRCCSNRCEAERKKAVQRQWRELHPTISAKSNASRRRKRAEARADRSCEHCGAAIEATRSTRRFCSDLCRGRHHHERRRSLPL